MMSILNILLTLAVAFKTIHANVKITALGYDLGGAPPNLTGVLEPNFRLSAAERYKVKQLQGPESFVFYKRANEEGTRILTGLADGRIVDISECGVHTVAKLPCAPGKCGRPLGLRLDYQNRLVVADSEKGIYRVNLETGKIELLFDIRTKVNGVACKFINDIAVAKDGTILFSDSSKKWGRDQFLYIVLEGEATGRILAYNDVKKATIVVQDNLAFPNGIQLAPDDSYLLISETSRARILKLHLTRDVLWRRLTVWASNLPGLPDNIRPSSTGGYWVAMSQARHENQTSLVDDYADKPEMREMAVMMSSMQQLLDMSPKYGMVVELDSDGNIKQSLQDPTGQQVAAISEAAEHDGYLYLGSYDQLHVSRVPIEKAFNVDRFISRIKSTCRAKKINLPKLRIVLKRIVALATFRRTILAAKARREERERLRLLQTTTAVPTVNGTVDDNATDSSTPSPTQSNVTESSGSSNVTSSGVTDAQTTSNDTASGNQTTTEASTSTEAPPSTIAAQTSTQSTADPEGGGGIVEVEVTTPSSPTSTSSSETSTAAASTAAATTASATTAEASTSAASTATSTAAASTAAASTAAASTEAVTASTAAATTSATTPAG